MTGLSKIKKPGHPIPVDEHDTLVHAAARVPGRGPSKRAFVNIATQSPMGAPPRPKHEIGRSLAQPSVW